jgi:hypothetical protein
VAGCKHKQSFNQPELDVGYNGLNVRGAEAGRQGTGGQMEEGSHLLLPKSERPNNHKPFQSPQERQRRFSAWTA